MPNFWDEHADLYADGAGGNLADYASQSAGAQIFNPNGNPDAGAAPVTGVAGPLNSPTAADSPASSSGQIVTKGYAAPQGPLPTTFNANNLFGTLDQKKLNDLNYQDPKYQVLRILSNFPSTPEGLKQAIGAVAQAYPGAQLSGKDSIKIPGVGDIDVGASFSDGGGKGWAWNAKTDAQGNRLNQPGFDFNGNNLWGPGSPYSPAQQAAFQANGGKYSGETPQGGAAPSSAAPTMSGGGYTGTYGGTGGGFNYTPPPRAARPAAWTGGPAPTGAPGAPDGRVASPMSDGGSMPAGVMRASAPAADGGLQASWSGPGPAPWEGSPSSVQLPQGNGATSYSYRDIAMPATVTAERLAAPAPIQAGTINAQTVAGPNMITPDRVVGPEALTAERIAAPAAFRAPTREEAENDAGYQFTLKAGESALQQSAAVKGLLRSGGTMKDLMSYGQDAASTQYDKVYGRRLNEYQTDTSNTLARTTANNQSAATAYGLTNQYQQQAQLANQGAKLTADVTNAQNLQRSREFNATQQQTAETANVGNRLTADTTTAGLQYSVARDNAANKLTSDTYNSQSGFARDQANEQNRLAYGAQGIAQGQLDLGRGQLDLGRGQLDLSRTQTANQYDLGRRANDLGYYTADQSYDTAMAGVGAQYHASDNSRDVGMANVGLGYTQASNSYNLGLGNLGLGWANYGLNANQQQFSQGYSMADLGLRAAGLYGGYTGTYGANAGNYATQAGNAGAAGIIGGANAWSGALGNIGNNIGGLAFYGATQPRTAAPSGGQQAIWTGPGAPPWQQGVNG